MSVLLGNLFQSGEKTKLCELYVEADKLVAKPKGEEGAESATFLFRHDNLSFGGDDGSQLVFKNDKGQTLYAEREHLEPLIKDKGDRQFQDRLKSESKRVVNAGRLAMASLFGFFALCGVGVWLLVLLMNWGVDRAVDQIPISWEESLGELVMQSQLGEEITDPAVVEPVQKVLDRLLEASDNQQYKIKLHVVSSPQLNAFAAPGGHVVVLTGLLEKTSSPDELAGVLAHELQHVYHRHGLRGLVHSVKWQIVAALILGDVGTVQHVVLGKAPDFLSLSYGRSLEEEADLDGVSLLCKAHLDPNGMVKFFQVMKENEAVSIPEFMSSHPNTENRIDNLQEWISDHPDCKVEPLDINWDEVKEAAESD